MTSLRTLEENGKTYAVIPMDDYDAMIQQCEDYGDAALLRAALDENDEQLPLSFCRELEEAQRANRPVVQLWRKYRGITQQQLAETVGISQPFIAQIEAGKKSAPFDTMKAIAAALDITIDDLG